MILTAMINLHAEQVRAVQPDYYNLKLFKNVVSDKEMKALERCAFTWSTCG